MRITSKGQVTIPLQIRERFGFLANTDVDFRVDRGAVRLVRTERKRGQSRGSALVGRLRGRADAKMTTDEILALTRVTGRS
jgi:AbrB family looped-hinge helix DNA binding protein